MPPNAQQEARPLSRFWFSAAVILTLAAGFRILLLAQDAFPFNADEAIVGLMARHILDGKVPIFFYGQAYLGSLDAILVAAGFALAGPSILAIRVVQTVLYLGTILTSMLLAREMRFSARATAIVGLLLVFPPVLFTLYTTVSLGGYGEALLLGNLILLLTLKLTRGKPSALALAGWGALAGVSLWAFALTLVYSFPAGGMLIRAAVAKEPNRARASKLGALALGIVAGAFPMVIWAWSHGPAALVGELLGSAIAGASPADFPSAVAVHAVNLVLFGPTVVLGARPPWDIFALGMPITPLAAVLSLAALGVGVRRSSWPQGAEPGRTLLGWVAALLVAGFLLTGFGADPSGRYFLPLVVILAITMAAGTTALAWRARPVLIYALLGLILGFHAWNHVQVGLRPPYFTTQFDAQTRYDHDFDPALLEFLLDQGETRGYATYWTAYPIAFLSGEQLVYLPHLPYHSDFRYTARDDRYPPYRDLVDRSPRVAYITARQPWLDEVLRGRLRALDVDYQETIIGDFHVFHGLTRPVRPDALDLRPEAGS